LSRRKLSCGCKLTQVPTLATRKFLCGLKNLFLTPLYDGSIRIFFPNLLRVDGRVDLLVPEEGADAVRQRLVGQGSGSATVHTKNLLKTKPANFSKRSLHKLPKTVRFGLS
jgi:hypothetical protein